MFKKSQVLIVKSGSLLLLNIKEKLKNISGDKKSVLALVGGTTIAQGINFVFSPIQTRLFSPEVFGELSVFTSITSIIGVIVCLRYELAIVLPKDDDEGYALFKLSWFFAALVSLLALVVFGVWGRHIYARFNAPGITKYWYYVPITLLLTGIIQAANYWLTRQRKFTVLSYNKVVPVLALNLVSIGLGLVGDRTLGARLLSILVANMVNIAVLATVLIPDSKVKREGIYKKTELISKYKNFLKYDILGALINNLSWMLVPILMNAYYGSFAAGQYSIGLKVIQLPASLIGAAIGQVFLKTANERKHQKKLYSYTINISKKLLLFTLPIAVFLLLFSKQLFVFVFGKEWLMAGIYTQILTPWAIVWFVSSPISAIYLVSQKQNVSLITSILNLTTRFLSLFLGKIFSSDVIGLMLFAISGIFINGLSLILCINLAKQNDKL